MYVMRTNIPRSFDFDAHHGLVHRLTDPAHSCDDRRFLQLDQSDHEKPSFAKKECDFESMDDFTYMRDGVTKRKELYRGVMILDIADRVFRLRQKISFIFEIEIVQ